ncbi:DUF6270 domain-containing protein [Arthrobacter gallicola]|uniref:DUF6270 domain-containing protein n=1 Tax=Arthrobacter gallicola TaxID=2762225 RepID=UPI001CD858B2
MDPLIRVAVLGSCVTRDIFNRTFNPGYRDLFECVALANQVSMVSLMSPPVSVDPDELNGLVPRVHGELLREFSRSFLDELTTTKPHYLIMDFRPDLVFGYSELDKGEIVTHNTWSTTKTRFYAGRELAWYRADRTPRKFMEAWTAAVDSFFAWAEVNIPDTKIIIHRARNVATWIAKDGETKQFRPWSVSMNRHWDVMDEYAMSKDGVESIDVLIPQQQSFEAHPWGPSALHYTFDYHQRFLSRLSRMALLDVIQETRSGGAPRSTAKHRRDGGTQ